MLGIESVEMALAYLLSIGAALLCVIYGLINYNVAGTSTAELREEAKKLEAAK